MNNEVMSTEQIWKLLSAKLRSFLLQRVSDPQVAEDLLQEAFLRIHKKLNHIEDEQRMTAWVFQIVRNLVIDHYRSKAPISTSVFDNLEAPSAEEDNLNERVEGWLLEMVAQLPDVYREAIELYELEGMSQLHIANKLGISLSGAKSRIQRGRQKLKTLLFDCCSFEQDRRGNIIGCVQHNLGDGHACDERCDA